MERFLCGQGSCEKSAPSYDLPLDLTVPKLNCIFSMYVFDIQFKSE